MTDLEPTEVLTTIKTFQGRPWNRGRFAEVQKACYSMLTPEEIRLLYWLTNQRYSGAGQIIDAGAFVGGSTNALATGLLDSGKQGLIRSFDLFVCGYFEGNHEALGRPGEGASFRPQFDLNIARVKDIVEVNEGDIQGFPFAEPIEILFLDCLKAPFINDFVVKELFSKLIPGKSIIIQQDYLHEYLPWIHVTMEMLEEYFAVITHTEVNSVAYLLIQEIPRGALDSIRWRDIEKEKKLAYMDSAISKWCGRQREFLISAREQIK